MNTNHLTVPEKLLLAALEVRKGNPTFTAEDLVVEAWRQNPDTFGLSGYSTEFPDSNRVLTNIMGTKGMRGKGWLRKVGEKQYQLTSAGLSDGQNLLGRKNGIDTTEERHFLRAELDRQAASTMARILSTQAARKALTGRSDAITFNDACGFWDITVRSNANTLNARLAEVTVLLDRVCAAVKQSKSGDGLKIGSVNVTEHQADLLSKVHHEMKERFKPELDIIRRRVDERLEKKVKPF